MKSIHKSFSWTIADTNAAYKVVDSTLIKNKETGVPLDIVYFFANTELDPGQELQSIIFYINNKALWITTEINEHIVIFLTYALFCSRQ